MLQCKLNFVWAVPFYKLKLYVPHAFTESNNQGYLKYISCSLRRENNQPSKQSITEEFQEEKFSDVSSLRSKLAELFGKYMNEAEFQVGYLTPGHGFRGKQLCLSSDDDLTQMYSEHHGRKSINLWLKLNSKKHKRPIDLWTSTGKAI